MMKKRVLSLVLCFTLLLLQLPAQAAAETMNSAGDQTINLASDFAGEQTAADLMPLYMDDPDPQPDNVFPQPEQPDETDTVIPHDEDLTGFVTPPRGVVPGEEDEFGYRQDAEGVLSLGNTNASSYLPSAYETQTTPVKNQGRNGLCWAFATYGMMETWLKVNYPEKGNFDLSEMHAGYAMSNTGGNTQYGFSRDPSQGANHTMMSAYLMRGEPLNSYGERVCIGGAVQEGYDPYSTNLLPIRDFSITSTDKPKSIMPENIMFLGGIKPDGNGASDETVKEAIIQYGSVAATLSWDDSNATSSTGVSSKVHYNSATAAYYLDVTAKGDADTYMNHMVQIIGWDDSYSRDNFNYDHRPSRNGAWKIKNSWGTDWGQGGFAWISYEDADFPSNVWAVDSVIGYSSSNWETHEYDYLGSGGYWMPYQDTLYVRYFPIYNEEVMTKARVYVNFADTELEVDVIPDYFHTDMSTYKFQSKGRITAPHPGWYTIPMHTKALLEPGTSDEVRYFAVVIRSNKALRYDNAYDGNSAFRRTEGSSDWHYSDSVGWCIKGITYKGQEYFNFIKAIHYLETGDNLWELLRGSNTDQGHIRYDLTRPGNGPYGTTFSYELLDDNISQTWFSENGSVSRPAYGTDSPQPFSFKVNFTYGQYSFWYSFTWYVDAYEGKVEVDFAKTSYDLGERITAQVTTYGNPGTLSFQWYRDGVLIQGATNSWYDIPASKEYSGRYVLQVLPGGDALVSYKGVYVTDVIHEGWLKIVGCWYYCNEDGEYLTGWNKISGKWYYLGSDGVMRTGWKKISGTWFYFGSDGAMRTNWQKIENVWYYFGSGGGMETGWRQIGGKWYYLGSDGAMRTDWKKINGEWFYLGSDGVMRTNWQKIGNVWYYFGSGGGMETGWQKIKEKWYYFGSDGAMRTDWKMINGTWFYLGSDGVMRTYWQKIGNVWYYFGPGGGMETGWQKIDGKWYYFGSGGAMQTGWLQIGNNWYYLKASGVMAANETLTINGKSYKFNASGVLIN